MTSFRERVTGFQALVFAVQMARYPVTQARHRREDRHVTGRLLTHSTVSSMKYVFLGKSNPRYQENSAVISGSLPKNTQCCA